VKEELEVRGVIIDFLKAMFALDEIAPSQNNEEFDEYLKLALIVMLKGSCNIFKIENYREKLEYAKSCSPKMFERGTEYRVVLDFKDSEDWIKSLAGKKLMARVFGERHVVLACHRKFIAYEEFVKEFDNEIKNGNFAKKNDQIINVIKNYIKSMYDIEELAGDSGNNKELDSYLKRALVVMYDDEFGSTAPGRNDFMNKLETMPSIDLLAELYLMKNLQLSGIGGRMDKIFKEVWEEEKKKI